MIISKRGAMLLSLAAAILVALPSHAASVAAADAKREAVGAAVGELLATLDGGPAAEKPRLGWGPGGHLSFFGAPPGVPATIDRSLAGGSAEEQAEAFFSAHRLAFGVDSVRVALTANRVSSTGDRTYVRLAQTYGGLPVFGAAMIVQLKDSGGVQAVMSDVMTKSDTLDEDPAALSPAVTGEAAQRLALADAQPRLKAKIAEYEAGLANLSEDDEVGAESIAATRKALSQMELHVSEAPELVIYDPSVVGNRGEPVPAWMLTICSSDPVVLCEEIFVDARSGKTVFSYSLIQNVKDREVWNWSFDPEGEPELMRDETSGPVPIYVPFWWYYNMDFDCLGMAYDYFYTNHGWDSYDGAGSTIVSNMYYFTNYTFTGWSYAAEAIRWGAYNLPTADDVVGHEFTHGVTQHTSGLIYANESGALNESLSDIWGEFIDLSGGWSSDPSGYKWLLGEDTLLAAFRDMESPNNFEQPETYKGRYWYTGTADYGGVHTNSGVGNKLCYLLTDGATFNNYTITGLGEATVRDLYWECEANLLCPASDYSHLYFALTQAAVNLSLSGSEKDDIENACLAVEIAPVNAFTVKDAEGTEWLQFQSDGDVLVMHGEVVENASDAQLTPSSNRAEWIVKLGSGDVVGLLNLDDGNLYIDGTVSAEQTTLAADPNTPELIVQDGQGTVLALIDDQGNLKFRGKLYGDFFPY